MPPAGNHRGQAPAAGWKWGYCRVLLHVAVGAGSLTHTEETIRYIVESDQLYLCFPTNGVRNACYRYCARS